MITKTSAQFAVTDKRPTRADVGHVVPLSACAADTENKGISERSPEPAGPVRHVGHDPKAKRAALTRAARRERQAAELLGTKRVKRSRYERAPDCDPVTLPCGMVVQPEVKTRKRLPLLIARALEQAEGYGPRGSIPAAILSETGGEPVICLPLRAFRIVAGLECEPEAAQITLTFDGRRTG